MNESITYTLRGIYFGIGFSLIGFLFLQSITIYNENNRAEMEKEIEEVFIGQEKNMVVKVIDKQKTEKGITTFVEVTNNNKESVHAFRAEVEFFSEKNKFIGECNTFIIKSLKPGFSENIEIFCEEKWKGWLNKVSYSKAKLKNEHKSFSMFY